MRNRLIESMKSSEFLNVKISSLPSDGSLEVDGDIQVSCLFHVVVPLSQKVL